MIDFSSALGQRATRRLQEEFVVWLTTIAPSGAPQPRPVWFVWDGVTFLIYSQPTAKKLLHIAHNPQVTLHFDGGPKCLDVQVFTGIAEVLPYPMPAHLDNRYSQKYGAEIRNMGASEEDFAGEYSVAIRIRPTRLRGMALPARS